MALLTLASLSPGLYLAERPNISRKAFCFFLRCFFLNLPWDWRIPEILFQVISPVFKPLGFGNWRDHQRNHGWHYGGELCTRAIGPGIKEEFHFMIHSLTFCMSAFYPYYSAAVDGFSVIYMSMV